MDVELDDTGLWIKALQGSGNNSVVRCSELWVARPSENHKERWTVCGREVVGMQLGVEINTLQCLHRLTRPCKSLSVLLQRKKEKELQTNNL